MKILNLRKGIENSSGRVDTLLSKYGAGGGAGGRDSLKDLLDVSVSTRTNGQVLKYNGTKWVNADLEAVEGDGDTIGFNTNDKLEVKDESITLDKLADNVLKADGGLSKSVNGIEIQPAEHAGYFLQTYEDASHNLVTRWASVPSTITAVKVNAVPSPAIENTLYLVETEISTIYHQYLQTSDELLDLGLTIINLVDQLKDLTDVKTTGATEGQILAYDSALEKWLPRDKYQLLSTGAIKENSGGKLYVKAYNGINVDANGVSVKPTIDGGLEVTSDGITIKDSSDSGLYTTTDGLFVNVDNATTLVNSAGRVAVKINDEGGLVSSASGIGVKADSNGGLFTGENGIKIKNNGIANAMIPTNEVSVSKLKCSTDVKDNVIVANSDGSQVGWSKLGVKNLNNFSVTITAGTGFTIDTQSINTVLGRTHIACTILVANTSAMSATANLLTFNRTPAFSYVTKVNKASGKWAIGSDIYAYVTSGSKAIQVYKDNLTNGSYIHVDLIIDFN